MNVNLTLGHTQRIIEVAREAGLTDPQIAYVLATARWETNHTMLPVEEAYYLGSKADAYRRKLRYWPWHGRGFVQLTWQPNYLRAGMELGVDLIAAPGLAMDPNVAAQVLVIGSRDGWFTGKKLADYIAGAKRDYRGARRIINGTDKASEIATIAEAYAAALLAQSANPIHEMQTILARLGLYTASVDGIDGPRTQAAITAFNTARDQIAALQGA